MDLSDNDRAGKSKAPRIPRQRRLKRKNLAESPVRSSKSSKKRSKKKDSTPPLYDINGILDERKSGKITEYLIDWRDNPETGESYEPTWEPYANVTEAAIYEWQNRPAIQNYSSQSQDSEPIRPAKRRRTHNAEVTVFSKERQGPNSKRAVGESVGTKNRIREIKDSYEDQDSGPGNGLSIVITLNKDINPNEYTVVRSSQLSDYSNSQEHLQASSPVQTQDSPGSPDSQRVLPRRRPAPAFIWDEDIEPDSQYLSRSTPYHPSIPRSASDSEDLQSVRPEISDRTRKGVSRSILGITQHNVKEQQKGSSNKLNQNEASLTSSIPDSFLIDNSFSSIDQDSAPPVSLTPHQHLRPEPPLEPAASEEESSQQPPVTDLPPALKPSIPNSQNILDQSPEEEEEEERETDRSETRKQSQIQSQLSLEIPDSYAVSDTPPKSSQTQGVDAHISSQDRASSLPTGQSQPEIVLSESQRSQSLPSAPNNNSSSEEAWQAAQIVTQVPRTLSQDHFCGNPESQGSKDHVQVDNTQVSNLAPTSPELNHHHLSESNSASGSQSNNGNRVALIEDHQTQPSGSEPSAGAQVLESIEFEAGLYNAQLESQEPLFSQDQAGLAWSSSGDLPAIASPSTKMSAVSHLAVGERRARSTKSRSPSTLPPRVATAPPTSSSNLPLPMRDNITDVPKPRNRATSMPRASIESPSMSPNILTVRKLGRNEFIIPLPMMNQVRDVYDTTVRDRKNDIISFLGESPTAADSETMDLMIEELKLICDHQDLIVEESSTQSLDDSTQARYAVTISTKFLFVQQFLDSLRSTKVHVVILAREMILPILEALFRFREYNYSRPDISGTPEKVTKDSMQITLLPTWIDVRDCLVAPASVVLAFDSSFPTSEVRDEYHQILPLDPKNPEKRVPLLWLVTTNSVEHIELCIPTRGSSRRKDKLVQYITQTRKVVGRLDTTIYPEPQQAAIAAAEYILEDPMEVSWPIVPMPDIDIPLPGYGAFNRRSDSLTQSLFSPAAPTIQPGSKRPSNFDAVDEDTAFKRQRLTPTRQGRELDLNTMNGNLVELNKELKILRSRCEDYEGSIKRIQPKFQRALDERARFEHENAQAVKRLSEYEKKLEIQGSAVTKLREENASLKNELAVAQNSLVTSAVPSVAELQKTKDELCTAQAEIERLKKNHMSAEKRADYATSLYQEHSQQNHEMRNQLATLQSERKGLQSEASAARVEIQKVNHDGIIQQQLDSINDLKRELAERERMLESVSRQLESYQNGRRTTRGTSVPRSPRMNTMSPRPRVMGNMAPGSNTASRGNSPTPGVFSGDLFPGGDAGRRFGAHLQ
ncbi:putative hda1 complex protein [Botrytis cinerea BcDW1]|uniref:Putative hda1 complex protein n=1 Tax=Botryotinia fuckeliana (strain BcDW1) TaxID=1290391 RepID=M7UTZ4_BOTF1|nr:putative hda1 complex protein [Botrytis cinerea BcDW1]